MSRLICLVVSIAVGLVAGEEAPRAKDIREYDLVQQAIAEPDPSKRLETLDTWSQEYAASDLRTMRTRLYLQSYREAARPAEAVDAAEQLLELEPADFAAHYTLASLAPVLGATGGEALERADRSARALLDGGISAQFEPGRRPENIPAAAWDKARSESRAASLRTLGWVAMQQDHHGEAEARLTEALEVEPASAQTSYWLAQSVLAQRDPAKNELAFFSLARAAALTGEGELSADSREKIRAYLRKTYEAYSGTLEGLEDFERLAVAAALPPSGMPRAPSAQERSANARAQFCREKPLVCVYQDLRAVLEGAEGLSVWSDLQGKLSPKMRLYVVGNEPPERPLALRLSSEKGGKTEVVLELANRLREAVPAGRAVTFEGIARGHRRNPFLLTLEQGRIVE